jgi:hypothetical protein
MLCLGGAYWWGFVGGDRLTVLYVLGGAAVINIPYGRLQVRRFGRGGPYDFSDLIACAVFIFLETLYVLGFLAFLLLGRLP